MHYLPELISFQGTYTVAGECSDKDAVLVSADQRVVDDILAIRVRVVSHTEVCRQNLVKPSRDPRIRVTLWLQQLHA